MYIKPEFVFAQHQKSKSILRLGVLKDKNQRFLKKNSQSQKYNFFHDLAHCAVSQRERLRGRKAANQLPKELSAIWKKSHSLKGSNCHHHKIKLYRDKRRSLFILAKRVANCMYIRYSFLQISNYLKDSMAFLYGTQGF